MKNILLLCLFIFIFWQWYSSPGTITLGPGVKAADIPQQEPIKTDSKFSFKEYEITPLAGFSIKAKVLSRKDYHFDSSAELSPVDLALGWGNMSDESIIEQINITQSNRWYRWNTKEFPIPRREIETSSANMHMIPKNKEITKLLKKVRRGDIVEITGKLVMVTSDQGYQWRSSLTRDDTGDGACELVWVEELKILTQ